MTFGLLASCRKAVIGRLEMKTLRHHIPALTGAAIAVFAMLMVSTVAFAAPALAPAMMETSGCAEMTPEKGSPICAVDCAVICHALITPPVVIIKVQTFEPVSYTTGPSRLTAVTVEKDDPPPR